MEKVYVMKSGDAYKVGVSVNPKTRLRHLKIGNPYLELIYQSWELSNGYAVESLIHKKLNPYKISNEWFDGISESEIIRITNKIVSSKGKTDNKSTSKNASANPMIIHLTCNGKRTSLEECIKQTEKEIQDMQFENAEIEKFTYSLQGYYVPNIFTDTILMTIFKTDSIAEIQEMLGITIAGNIYSLFSEDAVSEMRELEQLAASLINNYVNLNEIISIIRTGRVIKCQIQ